MLTRIISAAVGIAVAITILVFHKTIVLPIAIAVVIGVMIFELVRAVKLEKCYPILIAAEICGVSFPLIYYKWYDSFADTRNMITFCVTLACAFAIFITWLRKHKEIQYTQVFFVLASMMLIPQSMNTIILIEKQSEFHSVFYIVMGLCGAWIADSGAYFTGVAIGKKKLCPEISPKKTVEGFVGGIVSTAVFFIIAFIVYYKLISTQEVRFGVVQYAVIALDGAVCAAIGTLGDLSASMVKRQIGFKDYGKIMPGHGGFMDRFDSVLFVLPTFYLFVSLAGFLGNDYALIK